MTGEGVCLSPTENEKGPTLMGANCPSCDAPLSLDDQRSGWCDACGKKLPASLTVVRPLTSRRDMGLSELPAPSETHRAGEDYWGYRGRGSEQLASLGARLGGAVVDNLAGAVAIGPGYALMFYGAEARQDALILLGLALVAVLGLGLAVVQIVLLSTAGQTIGKKVVGTRIVNVDGSPAGFVGAFLLRQVVPGLIAGIPCVGGIFAFVDVCYVFNDDRRCLHDHIAGTKVVNA
jgi:uncharacterized RDD family membrane protein YckC